MVYEMERILEGGGRVHIQALRRNLPGEAKESHGNPPIIITGVPAENRTGNLQNINLQRYRKNQPARYYFFTNKEMGRGLMVGFVVLSCFR
jgi:hypothetical protein